MADPESPAGAVAGEQGDTLPQTLSGHKREAPETQKQRSFKSLGFLVLAMRRFQASLNPTYTYGKRPSSASGGPSASKSATESGEGTPSAAGRSGTPISPREQYAYSTHGHKFDFLLKPLPAEEDVQPRAAVVSSPGT